MTELKFGDVPLIAFLELSSTHVDPRLSETSKKNQILVLELIVIEKLKRCREIFLVNFALHKQIVAILHKLI